MSTQENDIWREGVREDFYTYLADRDWHKCEEIVTDLKRNNFVDEALDLQVELEETIAEENAHNKGSEDGVDQWQDK